MKIFWGGKVDPLGRLFWKIQKKSGVAFKKYAILNMVPDLKNLNFEGRLSPKRKIFFFENLILVIKTTQIFTSMKNLDLKSIKWPSRRVSSCLQIFHLRFMKHPIRGRKSFLGNIENPIFGFSESLQKVFSNWKESGSVLAYLSFYIGSKFTPHRISIFNWPNFVQPSTFKQPYLKNHFIYDAEIFRIFFPNL